jgi:four helix bundle protein
MDLVVSIYSETKSWPREELFGLTSHIRRAAVSIPANIAEGYGRETRGVYLQFLRIAQGSLKEIETHIIIARRTGIADEISTARMMEQAQSIGKLLRLLIRKLASD